MAMFWGADLPLTLAVERLAAAFGGLDDNTLDRQGWSWGEYGGVRMALIGTVQDLDDLGAEVLALRHATGNPPTIAQRLLARHHSAYWNLRSLLVGLSDADFTKPPAEGEWPVQTTLFHVIRTERGFLATILLGLAAQRSGTEATFDGEQMMVLTFRADPPPAENDSSSQMLSAYARLHELVLQEMIGLTDGELTARAPFWEAAQPSVRFRLGRFTAHLHEHTVQIEKTLAVVAPPTEARYHIRRLYHALAEVESALFGAPDLIEVCADLATVIERRIDAVLAALAESQHLFEAIRKGDGLEVQRLVTQNRQLVNATDANRLSALMTAVYYNQHAIVQILRSAGAEVDLFAAAAIGHLPEVEAHYQWNPKTVNWVAHDGFTPLQLACFFGQEAVARYLLERGADVHAVSRNAVGIQPIHAAVAGRNAAIVEAVVAAGADVNARQTSGNTPLEAALENRDEAIEQILRNAGATA
ncbi:MAG: DinB family protein [Caldilineaceae bacterium]|nr:DinB family protein [Caldilineaceae bacterium]